MDVGFVGLGKMGKAMAMSLVAAGHRVRVWNRSSDPVTELRRHGAEAASSPRDAFGGDAFISMLADDDAVREVVRDALPGQATSTVHVNMATISVACARELAELHARRGVPYVAAPVLGRPDVAAAGKLNIMAAGASADIARVQPLLDAMGQRIWRLGEEPSRANAVKIAANLTLACAIEAIAEGSALVEAHGIPTADFVEVLTNTLFNAPAYKGYGKQIADHRHEPAGFRLVLGLKDVRLALAAGEGASVPLPFASVLRDNFLDAIAHGDGGKDWSAIAEVAVRRARLPRA